MFVLRGRQAWRHCGWVLAWLVALMLLLPLASVQAATDTYVVQPGDSLSGIAAVTGVQVDDLISLNRIEGPNAIMAGAVLQLPSAANPASPAIAQSTYTVAVGDTLSGIALSAGVSPQVLVDLNGLPDGDHIAVGMVLLVPGSLLPAPVAVAPLVAAPILPSPPPAATTYMVTDGDTLFGIALNFGVGMGDLIALNGLASGDFITVGEVLRVPAAATPAPITTLTPTPVLSRTQVPSPTPAPTRSTTGLATTPTAVPLARPTSVPRGTPIISPVPTPGLALNPATLLRAAQIALQYRGARYVFGGVTPDGFDCSGLVFFVENQAGRTFPRDIFEQYDAGSHPTGPLQPGDLVFFQDTDVPGLSHVGIYLGNGQFEDAIDEAHGVSVSNLGDAYWLSHWYGATRRS